MATARELSVGDPVESPAGCRGQVVSVRDGAVTVRFVDFRKHAWQTVYTPEWFAKWAQYLRKLPR